MNNNYNNLDIQRVKMYMLKYVKCINKLTTNCTKNFETGRYADYMGLFLGPDPGIEVEIFNNSGKQGKEPQVFFEEAVICCRLEGAKLEEVPVHVYGYIDFGVKE